MDLADLTSGLVLDPNGYWAAPGSANVSYPAEGSDFCLSVEDCSFWFAHRNQVICAAIRRFPPAAGPILDVGAGNGFVTAALAREGWPTIAIEPSRAGATNAVNRGLRDVVCGSLPSPCFKERIAGGIALFDVLEHIEAPEAFLTSLRPYLKPGGRIYVTTPAYQWLWSSDDVEAGHKRRYTLSALRRTFAAAGLRLEYGTYIFSWLPAPLLLLRVLSARLRGESNRKSAATEASEHRLGGAWLRSLVTKTFAFETMLVNRGLRLPFGASCLAVASVEA